MGGRSWARIVVDLGFCTEGVTSSPSALVRRFPRVRVGGAGPVGTGGLGSAGCGGEGPQCGDGVDDELSPGVADRELRCPRAGPDRSPGLVDRSQCPVGVGGQAGDRGRHGRIRRHEPEHAGTGIRQVTSLLGGKAFEGTILLSHLHWDHLNGLPFFAAGDRDDATVALYVPEQDRSAEDLMAQAMSPPIFPIDPTGLRGTWRLGSLAEGEHTFGGFTVLAREIPHKGGRTFGYRVSDGRTSLAYLPDHHPATLGPGPTGTGSEHDVARRLADGVELLIHRRVKTGQ